jgi:hypothetical protein
VVIGENSARRPFGPRPTGVPPAVTSWLDKLIQLGVEAKINEYPLSATKVDAEADRILEEKLNRLGWYFYNRSSNSIYLGFNNKVGSSRCILVEANKDVHFNVLEAPGIPSKEVWACAAADNSEFYLFEVVK